VSSASFPFVFAAARRPKIEVVRPKKEEHYQIGMSAAPGKAGKTIAQLRAEKAAEKAAAAAPVLAPAAAPGRGAAAAATAARSRRPAVARPAGPVARAAGTTAPFEAVARDPKHEEVLRFRLTPTHVSYANTLRRTMITEVETVAFRADILEDGSTGDVKILKNSTPMSNEMLAHRIGLIPLFIQKPLDWVAEKVIFKCNVTNDSGEPRDVTASDIEVFEDRGSEEEPLRIENRKLFRADPLTRTAANPNGDTCLIAVLKGRVSGQEPETLSFVAKATLGTGRQNARYMPVTSRCSYGYTLDDDADRRKEFFVRWLRSYKKTEPAELDADAEKKAAFEREFETMEVQRCYKVDEAGEPYSFDFAVESVSVLDPVYVVGRALSILQTKLLRFASIDSGDLPSELRITPAEARMKGFDFLFTGEDHTLGNLLQTWMEQNLLDSGDITFAGYKVPHPLRDEMLLRVGVEDGKDSTARAALARACRELAQMFRNWEAAWTAASNGV
jgi:DNA-directed RNA polymerase subunit L